MHSPTAIQAKGDDYNRNPVGTGPFVAEVVDGRRPNGGGAQSRLLEQGPSLSRPHRAAAAARFAVAFRQPEVGRDRSGVGRRVRGRQHRAGAQGCDAAGAHLRRLGRGGERHQHQGAAARRRARAPGAGHGDRPQEDVAGADQRPRPSGEQSLRRRLVGQVQGRRRAAGRCRQGRCADQGVRQAGIDFKMLFTATPRGRANGQVLQQFWKNIGVNMEIEQVDQATIPPRAFQRKFRHHSLADRRSRRIPTCRCTRTSTAAAR